MHWSHTYVVAQTYLAVQSSKAVDGVNSVCLYEAEVDFLFASFLYECSALNGAAVTFWRIQS